MRFLALGIFVFETLSIAGSTGCKDLPDPFDNTGGSGNSGSGTGGFDDPTVNTKCAVGAKCNSNVAFCCDGKALLECNNETLGEYELKELCAGGIDECIDGSSTCGCVPGKTACKSDTVAEKCVEGVTGDKFPFDFECAAGEICVPGSGCSVIVDFCKIGEPLKCSLEQPGVVLECQRVPEAGNAALFVPILNCRNEGFEICKEFGPMSADPFQMCVNECGGRGVPLPHRVCAPGEGGDPPCSVYLCDGPNKMTVDHTNCFPGGAGCTYDAECVSCSCQENTCVGSQHAFCGDAQKACNGN